MVTKMEKNSILLFLFVIWLFLNGAIIAQSDSSRENIEAMPLISYDTDVGLGYGGKLFLFDLFETEESFDFLLFNSSKGEQWYRFAYSYPDFESRQGTKFPIAVDLIAEYDKYSKYTYYLPIAKYDCIYEKSIVGLFFSKGFLKDFTSTLAFLYKSYSLYDLTPATNPDPQFILTPQGGSEQYLSWLINIKWDTRNSYINPKSGISSTLEIEYAPGFDMNSSSFLRGLLTIQHYKEILLKDLILALRASTETISSSDIPSFFKTILIGGNNTVRGIPMDKYRYNRVILLNGELRFPIWWKFGGIAGIDLAKGSSNFHDESPEWLFSTVAGIRFYMDNFIVRADLGFSKEGMGLYLNFGHLF